MPSPLRLKTYPEILDGMLARARRLLNNDVDVLPGSWVRTTLECSALPIAENHVQIGRVTDLYSLDNCKGDDLDERAVEMGSAIFPPLRRRPANTSISQVVVGDGTLVKTALLALDASYGDPSFTVDDGSALPIAGQGVLDRGTDLEESFVFTRSGNVLTVIYPTASLARSHAIGAQFVTTSIQTTLAANVTVGATTVTLRAGTGAAWTASGSVIFERDTTRREKLTFTRSVDTLTLGGPTSFAHASGTVVVQSTTGTDRAINTSSKPYVPATPSTKQINFHVSQSGFVYDGDFVSGLIDVESDDVGLDTRAGANTITQWSTPPFSGATVTNPAAATRGVDREKDDPYRTRLKSFRASQSGSTAFAISQLVNGLHDPDTNTDVAFAQLIEPVAPGVTLLYITDGTPSFSLGMTPFIGRDVIISDAETGDRRGRLSKTAPYGYLATGATHPRIFRSVPTGFGVSTSVGVNELDDTTKTWTAGQFAGGNFYLKTDDDQFYQISTNSVTQINLTGGVTPSNGSYAIFNFGAAPLIPGTDFNFNQSVGDLELVASLAAHESLVAASDGASPSIGAYLYATGLAAYVQRKVNGDPTDFSDFPGMRSTGTQVLVTAPTVIAKTFIIKVVAKSGFSDAQIRPSVSVAVQTYVNSLGIGDNIILSDIITAVKALPGVYDVVPLDPATNFATPAGVMVRITDSDVDVE